MGPHSETHFRKCLSALDWKTRSVNKHLIFLLLIQMSKIHTFTGDNATSNDTEVAWLQEKNNSFNTSNYVHCFNHTIQLSCKALLKPFTSSIASSVTDSDNMLDLEGVEDDDKDPDTELALNVDDNVDDNIDELDVLSGKEQAMFLEETVAVKEAVTKVRML